MSNSPLSTIGRGSYSGSRQRKSSAPLPASGAPAKSKWSTPKSAFSPQPSRGGGGGQSSGKLVSFAANGSQQNSGASATPPQVPPFQKGRGGGNAASPRAGPARARNGWQFKSDATATPPDVAQRTNVSTGFQGGRGGGGDPASSRTRRTRKRSSGAPRSSSRRRPGVGDSQSPKNFVSPAANDSPVNSGALVHLNVPTQRLPPTTTESRHFTSQNLFPANAILTGTLMMMLNLLTSGTRRDSINNLIRLNKKTQGRQFNFHVPTRQFKQFLYQKFTSLPKDKRNAFSWAKMVPNMLGYSNDCVWYEPLRLAALDSWCFPNDLLFDSYGLQALEQELRSVGTHEGVLPDDDVLLNIQRRRVDPTQNRGSDSGSDSGPDSGSASIPECKAAFHNRILKKFDTYFKKAPDLFLLVQRYIYMELRKAYFYKKRAEAGARSHSR